MNCEKITELLTFQLRGFGYPTALSSFPGLFQPRGTDEILKKSRSTTFAGLDQSGNSRVGICEDWTDL